MAKETMTTTNDQEVFGKPPTDSPGQPPATEVVSVRIPGTEFQVLYDLATWKGESVSALVRRAVADWLDGDIGAGPASSVEVWPSARMMTVWHNYGRSSTEAIPDFPPATVQGPTSRPT